MPLNRDQHQADGRLAVNAEGFTTNRQQSRSNPVKVDVPQDDTRVSSHGRKGSVDQPEDVVKTGKKYALDPDEPVGSDLKIPISTTLPPKQEKNMFQRVQAPAARQSKMGLNQRIHRVEAEENNNPFDTTRSFDVSFDNSEDGENHTTIQRPQSRVSQQEPENPRHVTHSSERYPRTMSASYGIGKSDPNYKKDVEAARDLLTGRGFASDHRNEYNFPDELNQQNEMQRRSSISSDSIPPDTPSRSRSVPIQNDIVAPVARKGVAINSSPQFMGPPAVLRSEEIAREDSPDIPQVRPRSAQSGARGIALLQRPHQRQPLPQSQLRESQTAHSGRFQTAGVHNRSAHTRGQKVSALESDVPESSEDERSVHLEDKSTHAPANSYIDRKLLHGRKRSHDEVHALDYDESVMEQKSLAELQSEPFIKDPRDNTEPQLDSMGNNLSLSTVFEKWSKLSDEVLKNVFRSQTDDEWAQTGQWFVDSFQADLKELMEVRLERRKVALDFEDQIRRRQREVEHYRAGFDKELRELQEGGIDLLRDRKLTTGSRSNTPVKPARPH